MPVAVAGTHQLRTVEDQRGSGHHQKWKAKQGEGTTPGAPGKKCFETGAGEYRRRDETHPQQSTRAVGVNVFETGQDVEDAVERRLPSRQDAGEHHDRGEEGKPVARPADEERERGQDEDGRTEGHRSEIQIIRQRVTKEGHERLGSDQVVAADDTSVIPARNIGYAADVQPWQQPGRSQKKAECQHRGGCSQGVHPSATETAIGLDRPD